MEQQDIDEQFANLNAALFKDTLVIPDRIYIDLRLLKDVLFGTIFTFLLEEPNTAVASAKYEYIKDRMPEWITRTYDDPAYYFPDLKISNARIRERMTDPTYHDAIFRASPLCEFSWVLANHLQLNANHSNVAGQLQKKSGTDEVYLTVNTYPLILGPSQQKLMATFLAIQFGVTTRVVSIAPEALTSKFVIEHQEMYFCYVADVTKSAEVNKAFSDTRLLQHRVFAGRFHGTTVPTKIDLGFASRELEIMEGTLGILSDFKYIPSNLIFPARDRKPKA